MKIFLAFEVHQLIKNHESCDWAIKKWKSMASCENGFYKYKGELNFWNQLREIEPHGIAPLSSKKSFIL